MIPSRGFKRFLIVFIVYFGLAVFLVNTDPTQLPLIILIVPFGLIFLGVLLPILFLTDKQTTYSPASHKKRLLIASCLAAVPTLVLLLSSINQLSYKDIILMAVLALLVAFYLRRTTFLYR